MQTKRISKIECKKVGDFGCKACIGIPRDPFFMTKKWPFLIFTPDLDILHPKFGYNSPQTFATGFCGMYFATVIADEGATPR